MVYVPPFNMEYMRFTVENLRFKLNVLRFMVEDMRFKQDDMIFKAEDMRYEIQRGCHMRYEKRGCKTANKYCLGMVVSELC